MPQFDPTWFASQMFWVLVTFSATFLLVAGYAVPKIVAVMTERNDKIEKNLKKAEQLKAEAFYILSEYQKAIASAEENSKKTLADAQTVMVLTLKEKEKEVSDSLSAKIAEGESVLAAEKQKALGGLQALAQMLTVEIVKKLANEDVDAEEVKAKIAQATEKTA